MASSDLDFDDIDVSGEAWLRFIDAAQSKHRIIDDAPDQGPAKRRKRWRVGMLQPSQPCGQELALAIQQSDVDLYKDAANHWKECSEGLATENEILWEKNKALRNEVLQLTAKLVGRKTRLEDDPSDFSW